MSKLPIGADILPPSDDRIFKALLTHSDATCVLIDVAAAATERPIVAVQVRNAELPVMDVDEKAQRLDVNCTVDGGDQVNVEMHSSRIEEAAGEEHRNFINKYIYYATDLHSSQKSKGKEYADFVRTYQVTFCGYTVLPQRRDFVNRAALRFPDGEQFSDQMNMVIVELSKIDNLLTKPVDELTPLELWSLFFRFADDLTHRKLINNIISIKEEVAMASTLLQEISKDEHERALFRSRRMYETDTASNLLTVERRGEARGRMEGEMKRAIEIAKKLLARGMSVEDIAEDTKLTVDEILKL